MNKIIFEKSFKPTVIFFFIVFIISFGYGGIYNEMILIKQGISFVNIFLALIGSLFGAALISIFFFICVLFITYSYYWFKKRK